MRNVPDGPVEPKGLPAGEIDHLFSGLTSFSGLALAVSGGADSLTLLVLFSEWKRRTHWQGAAEVLCVDHGLRPESASEAAFVARVAAEHGLTCAILRWDGEKPGRNIQEEARRARYRLIAAHMEQEGHEALLLGHHLDDQAETFLDRLTRGSGISGLAAMAPDETAGPFGLRLLRPFLGVPKARLESSLRERGLSWCEDPSNRNRRYKRSRLRRILELLAEEGLTADRIARTSGHMRRAREALEETAQDLVGRHVVEHPAGPLKVSREVFRGIAPDLRMRFLCRLIEHVTAQRPRPRFEKLRTLDALLMEKANCRHTLAGALFAADTQTIWCWKEPGRVPPETLTVEAGGGIWDNRFRYSGSGSGGEGEGPSVPLKLGPLFRAPVSAKEISWPEGWPREAFDCAPVFWNAGGEVLGSSVTAELGLDRSGRSAVLILERVPFRCKLSRNPIDEEDADGEI